MYQSISKFFCLRLQYLNLPLAGLLLMSNIGVSEAKPSITNDNKAPIAHQLVVRTEALGEDRGSISKGKIPTQDGIYLYGQSPEPNQIGQEYMVFEVRQAKVVGAFYLPQSEFSCFQGSLASGNLAVMIADDPSSTPYADPIAGQNSQQVATASDSSQIGSEYEQMTSPYSVALQNYYQLSSISANERRILAACKSNYR